MPILRTDLTMVPHARRRVDWASVAEHGGVWEYLPDEDFVSTPDALCANARHWGSKHGYSVSATVTDKGSVLAQFRPMQRTTQQTAA